MVQQEDDKVTLAIVQSGSTQAAYAWVEAIPKTAKTTMEAPVFSDALQRRLLVNKPMIPTGMTCVCKAHLDEQIQERVNYQDTRPPQQGSSGIP